MADRKTRSFNTTTTLVRLRQLVDHYDGKAAKVSTSLGYSASAASLWLKEGKMPIVADLACEGLLRRLGSSLRKTELAIVKGTSAEMSTFRPVADALKAMIIETMADSQGSLFVLQIPVEICGTVEVVAQRMGCSFKKVQLV